MNDPFNRNKTKEARLGELITKLGEQNQRDAIHIAVVPVKARERLRPGMHVSILHDGTNAEAYGDVAGSTTAVGIVDPFLPKTVEIGQTFWLCLYQGQVTTLRHEWTHPAFPAVDKVDQQSRDDKEVSKSWLRQYAARTSPYDDADVAYARLLDGLRNKEIHYSGRDMHSRGDLVDEVELKYHAEIVLGCTVDFDDENFSFTCSC